MNFEIKPLAEIGKQSLSLNGVRLPIDRAENVFRTSLSSRDGLFDAYSLVEDAEQLISTNREQRAAVDKKYPISLKLTEKGAAFLHDTFQVFGPMMFTFYNDDQDPFASKPQSERIKAISKGYRIAVGALVSLGECNTA